MTGVLRQNLVAAPLLVPLAAAVAGFALAPRGRALGVVGLIAAAAQIAAAARLLAAVRTDGVVALAVGDWPAPYGIVLAADLLSAVMVLVAALVAAAVLLYGMAHASALLEEGRLFAFYHCLLVGVNGVFLTGDLFNLFVWFEVTLMASYVLVPIGATDSQLREGITYMVLNMFASAVLLVGIALVYRVAGTLNLADLAVKARALGDAPALTAVSLLVLFAFAAKAGLVPLFFWLPRPYDASPAVVTPIFAALLTKVGVFALLRGFGMVFVGHPDATLGLLALMAVVTMLAGALGALRCGSRGSPSRS